MIDCGTNSIKFHVGERGDDGTWSVVVDRAEITRLGEGMEDTGRISPEAIQRTVDAVSGMAEEARALHVRAIAAVGTAGLRAASNGDEVVRAIDEATGIEVQVISGEEESRLAYLAVRAGLGAIDGPVVVFDSGGGSTQFTFGEGDAVHERFSLEVGAVRYTERFGLAGAVSADVLAEALEAIAADLARLDGRPAAGRGGRDGRDRHQPHGGEPRARPLRSRPRAGRHARPGGDRPADRAVPHPRRRGPPRRSSASSRSAPTSSWPAPASCGRCWTGWHRMS